jgi:hypothetical protein
MTASQQPLAVALALHLPFGADRKYASTHGTLFRAVQQVTFAILLQCLTVNLQQTR